MTESNVDREALQGGGPSQLLEAFVSYLRVPSTRGDDGSPRFEGVSLQSGELGGVSVITLKPLAGRPERTVLYFHGGGYVSGSPPDRYLPLAAAVALAANARVHVVDYRLAPETPFPGAFDDCLRAYHFLVTRSGADMETVVLLGDSAGGNLAVAVTAAARDQGLPLPARIAVLSPFADLTLSGASIEERKHLDPLVTREMLDATVRDYLARATRGALPSSLTCAVFRQCSSRSARTRSSTTIPPGSGTQPRPLASTRPSSPGVTDSTSGPSLSPPDCRSRPPPSNASQPSSRPLRVEPPAPVSLSSAATMLGPGLVFTTLLAWG